MINAGSLAYLSVCFSGHNVTVVAADAYPVSPFTASCVDINLGQRCALCHIMHFALSITDGQDLAL